MEKKIHEGKNMKEKSTKEKSMTERGMGKGAREKHGEKTWRKEAKMRENMEERSVKQGFKDA